MRMRVAMVARAVGRAVEVETAQDQWLARPEE